MNRPKLICCNFIPETKELKNFALEHGFDGVDWTFNSENLPQNPMQESLTVKTITALHPLEVRYHCAFNKTDLGDVDSKKADEALKIFRRVCLLVSKSGGQFLTIHVNGGYWNCAKKERSLTRSGS